MSFIVVYGIVWNFYFFVDRNWFGFSEPGSNKGFLKILLRFFISSSANGPSVNSEILFCGANWKDFLIPPPPSPTLNTVPYRDHSLWPVFSGDMGSTRQQVESFYRQEFNPFLKQKLVIVASIKSRPMLIRTEPFTLLWIRIQALKIKVLHFFFLLFKISIFSIW